MTNLVKVENYRGLTRFESQLVNLGFYPSKLSKNRKCFVVRDPKNDREMHFELEDYVFNSIEYADLDFDDEDCPVQVPKKIRKVMDDIDLDNSVFDEYRVIYPAESFSKDDEKYIAPSINSDPFLVGIRNGKMFVISSWGMDVWEQ